MGWAVCLLLLSFAVRALPQSPAAKPVIQSNVNEVSIDLVVRDKHGHPIQDLKPDEIEISDDGSPARITGMRLMTDPGIPNTGSLSAPGEIRAVRLISLVFDQLHSESIHAARKMVDELLKEASGQEVAFSVWNLRERLKLVQTFSTDRSAISAAVDSVLKPKKGQGEHANSDLSFIGSDVKPFAAKMLSVEEMSRQIGWEENVPPFAAGLLALIRQQTTFPGRKSLLYFSDGFQIASSTYAQRESILGAANRANLSVYSIDTSGVDPNQHNEGLGTLHGNMAGINPGAPAVAISGLNQPSASDTLNGINNQISTAHAGSAATTHGSQGGNQLPLEDLARKTGGFYVFEGNTRGAAARILEDCSVFYEVTYVPKRLEYDGHFRAISVRVNRPHAYVQSRAGYFSFPPNVGTDIRPFELPLLKSLDESVRRQTIPLRAKVLHFGQQGDQARAEIVVEAPLNELGYRENNKLLRMHISVVALVKDAAGQVVQKMSEDLPVETATENAERARAGFFTFERGFSGAPGKYSLELALSDQINKTLSTATFPFDLPSEPNGVGISDIALIRRLETRAGSQGSLLEYKGRRVVAELEPSPAPGASDAPFFFTVYPATASISKPHIEVELKQHGTVLAKSELALPKTNPGDPIPMVASFSSKTLSPGDYEIVAKATQDSVTRQQSLILAISGDAPHSDKIQTNSPAEPEPASLTAFVQPKLLEGRQKPADTEVARIIESARQRAIDYKSDLPNFNCTLVTRRALDKNGRQDWRQQDLLTETLRYIDGAEEHKVLKVDTPSGSGDSLASAVRSEGEFGGFLDAVFSQKASAHFVWDGYADVDGHETAAYKYEVPLNHSLYVLTSHERRVPVAYHGFVYIDPNTLDVRRISLEADNVPKDFPIRESALSIDYSYVSIGEGQYLLPKMATLYVREGKRRFSRNEKEFRDYRRYTGEATIKFD